MTIFNYSSSYDFRIPSKAPPLVGAFTPLQPIFNVLYNSIQQIIRAIVPLMNILPSSGLIKPVTFILSSLPAASANVDSLAIVTDGSAGKWMVKSNGVNWIYTDGTIAI